MFGLLRKCYQDDPAAFSVAHLPHAHAGSHPHITVRHKHPFTYERPGLSVLADLHTDYHIYFRDEVKPDGRVKRIWLALTALDADLNTMVIARWAL